MILSQIPRRFWTFAGATVLVDWLTKALVHAFLTPNQMVDVVGNWVRFVLVYDVARALSFGSAWIAIIGIKVLMLALMLWFVARTPPVHRWSAQLGMLFSAGLCNTMELAATGRVTNFIDIGVSDTRWPAFNLADVLFVVSAVWLLVIPLRVLLAKRR